MTRRNVKSRRQWAFFHQQKQWLVSMTTEGLSKKDLLCLVYIRMCLVPLCCILLKGERGSYSGVCLGIQYSEVLMSLCEPLWFNKGIPDKTRPPFLAVSTVFCGFVCLFAVWNSHVNELWKHQGLSGRYLNVMTSFQIVS